VGFLEWLGEFLHEIFPPWEICPKTHRAVRQRNVPLPAILKSRWTGVLIRDCGPGWALRIPFIDELWQLPVTYESDDLENVEVETADGIVYDVSPVLTWRVSNVIKATFDVSNYENSLKNDVRAAVVAWANRQDGRLNVGKMSEECTKLAKPLGSEWGCRVQKVTINSCARPWQTYELQHRVADKDE